MTAYEVPEGIPQGLSVGEVARVLRLRDETIKGLLKSGALPSWQLSPGRRGWRMVTPDAVADFAAVRGLSLDWESVL